MQKILFISRAKERDVPSVLVANQAKSLAGFISIDHYLVRGKGVGAYLKAIFSIRKQARSGSYDLLHSHYGFCGLITVLAFPKIPVIVSFMGSDLPPARRTVLRKPVEWTKLLTLRIIHLLSDGIIVKSAGMADRIRTKNKPAIIPNGVDLGNFRPMDRKAANPVPRLSPDRKTILFLGNPNDPNKNYNLLSKAWKEHLVGLADLVCPYPVEPEKIPDYLNSCDVLALVSIHEGSPNVVKEAMACNRPIVATRVGDVEWLTQGLPGHFISEPTVDQVAQNLVSAIRFSETTGATEGRKRLIERGLDSNSVAQKLLSVYNEVLSKKKKFDTC